MSRLTSVVGVDASAKPRSLALAWLAFAALFAAAVALIRYDASISTIAFLLCALMCWTRVFEKNAAKGKPMLSRRGRAMVGGVLAVFGYLLLPNRVDTPAGGPPRPVYIGNGQTARVTVVEYRRRMKQLLANQQAMERRNKEKIESLLAAVKNLSERDYEGQMALWQSITALAPANTVYARKKQQTADKLAEVASAVENPERGASIEKIRPRKEGFGHVLAIDVTIRNDSLSDLKDFQMTCASRGPSGTIMDNNTRTLYKIVEARTTRMFRKVNMGLLNSQATSTSCVIDEAVIA